MIRPTTTEPILAIDSLPIWAPVEFVEWLKQMQGKLPLKKWNLYLTLISDLRMRTVWDWHASERIKATHSIFGSALSFCMSVEGAMKLPNKPGNMTDAQRNIYFGKVRKHTEALIALLRDTRYSANSATHSGRQTDNAIDEDQLGSTVVRQLENRGELEDGHVVAYYVDEDGVYPLPWHYPESELLDLLSDVIDWTRWEDGWDWNLGLSSSRPLAVAKESSARTIYFSCTLYENLSRHGLQVPFSQLATVANVALCIAPDDLLDEETVRKQVRRYQSRTPPEKLKGEDPF